MTFDIEIRLEGFVPSQSQSTDVLHIRWNSSRRVFRFTDNGILPPSEDEPLCPSASASFGMHFGQASDMHPKIWRSLESLNFTRMVTNVLCPRITAFAHRLAAGRLGPDYPSFIVFAHLNFIEKLYVDSIGRPLMASGLVDETFVLGTPTEDSNSSDDEEGEEDDSEGDSNSAIETLRRRKLDRRGGDEESCSVCLETFSDSEEVIPLQCEHVYHESCIVTWLKKSQSCPLCRRREI